MKMKVIVAMAATLVLTVSAACGKTANDNNADDSIADTTALQPEVTSESISDTALPQVDEATSDMNQDDSKAVVNSKADAKPAASEAGHSEEPKAEEPKAIEKKLPVVIDFYAVWCGPCKAIAPLFDMLKTEYAGKVEFRSVDVDRDLATAEKYRIEAMPTFVFLNPEGKEIDRIVGADSGALETKVRALATH